MIDVNWKPSHRQLRQFALLLLLCAGGVGLYLFFVRDVTLWTCVILWVAAVVFGAGGLAVPAIARPAYLVLMAIAFPIGTVLALVCMMLLYYLVFTPIGLVLRVIGYDPMRRRLDREAESYWTERSAPAENERYFRQY